MNLVKKYSNQELASEINALHKSAIENAELAVSKAIDAGKLLLKVKSSLKHGEFTAYVKDELNLSLRQCQRYMAAAKGKKPLQLSDLNVKSDIMSFLKKTEQFFPLPGMVYMLPTDNGEDIKALVECYAEHPEFFFVTVYGDPTMEHRHTTIRPVESIMVHHNLEFFGLESPYKRKWKFKKSKGVNQSEESLYGVLEEPAELITPLMAPRKMNIETGDIDWKSPYIDLQMPEELIRILMPTPLERSNT